ncbi:hypothetical protein GGX14DRAFT_394853 [Mycena pura]|uniref:Uncharacterized protein n=1 Tax=Mycena pura TaxID=153505 RepID=A0AAD6VKY2_9AGAR|nr:hypothetical protein GGX14DRAFT_394853 [Mycena pura]
MFEDAYTPVFLKSTAFSVNLDLRKLFGYLRQLVCQINRNWLKLFEPCAPLPSTSTKRHNRTARRQQMLKEWREARREDSTITWTLWKRAAVIIRWFEKYDLLSEHGHDLTPSASVIPIRRALIVLLLSLCVVNVVGSSASSASLKRSYAAAMGHIRLGTTTSAPSSPSYSHSDPIQFPEFRQCDWRDSEVQCTRNRDINSRLCSIHQIYANHDHVGRSRGRSVETIDPHPQQKRSRISKEPENLPPSANTIHRYVPVGDPAVSITAVNEIYYPRKMALELGKSITEFVKYWLSPEEKMWEKLDFFV